MKKTAEKLSAKQIEFIATEFGVEKDTIKLLEEDKWDEIYDGICDIEIEELSDLKEGKKETVRCKTASELVTLFGNAIAEEEGSFDEEEFENDLK